jgi:hypothetical protein
VEIGKFLHKQKKLGTDSTTRRAGAQIRQEDGCALVAVRRRVYVARMSKTNSGQDLGVGTEGWKSGPIAEAHGTGSGSICSSEIGRWAGHPERFCPNCSTELAESRCKLACLGCGFYLSCSDFY